MQQVLVVAGAIVVLGAAVTVLVRAALWANRMGERIRDFLDDWQGEHTRPGVPSRPGVVERLTVIEDRLNTVERELRPNAGKTLRDAMDRVEQAVSPHAAADA